MNKRPLEVNWDWRSNPQKPWWAGTILWAIFWIGLFTAIILTKGGC